ncbi:MAG: DUF3301 domain-containing protein [Motiliproteus sp.]|nr:DUF3301 domain-containing protein [Motiliproteus sp.]MCW9052905.1 DUF3301 domain-containing protein [Motiliproteus sp.]
MVFELSDLFWLLTIYLIVLYWWNAKGVKEVALKATLKHCQEMEVQLLDQSISLRGFWVKRDSGGRLRFWRSYNFDFSSNGDDRYQGRIIILGKRIESIQLEPHRLEH